MKSEIDDIRELVALEKQEEEISRRRSVILKRMAQRARYFSKIEQSFPSKIAAMEHFLRQTGSVQHIKKITAEISRFGFNAASERTLSGMLRNYARQRKVFTAEGSNTFGLIDWSKKND